MKTANIIKIIMLSIVLGASTQKAFAAETVTCQASNHESFDFQFDTEPSPNLVNSGIANDLHPKGVAIKSFPIEINVRMVATRLGIIGLQYSFTLPNGTSVFLTDTTAGSELGFSGIAQLIDGTSVGLKCK